MLITDDLGKYDLKLLLIQCGRGIYVCKLKPL